MKEKASSSRTLKRVIQNLEGQKHLVVLSFLLALVSVAGNAVCADLSWPGD